MNGCPLPQAREGLNKCFEDHHMQGKRRSSSFCAFQTCSENPSLPAPATPLLPTLAEMKGTSRLSKSLLRRVAMKPFPHKRQQLLDHREDRDQEFRQFAALPGMGSAQAQLACLQGLALFGCISHSRIRLTGLLQSGDPIASQEKEQKYSQETQEEF